MTLSYQVYSFLLYFIILISSQEVVRKNRLPEFVEVQVQMQPIFQAT